MNLTLTLNIEKRGRKNPEKEAVLSPEIDGPDQGPEGHGQGLGDPNQEQGEPGQKIGGPEVEIKDLIPLKDLVQGIDGPRTITEDVQDPELGKAANIENEKVATDPSAETASLETEADTSQTHLQQIMQE